jgi:hypothetical protein
LPELRHQEIYAEAAAPVFDRLSTQEQLEWLAGVLQDFRINLPTATRPAAEIRMERLFTSPNPDARLAALREEAATLLARIAQFQALGDGPSRRPDRARARTLLLHFGFIWRLRPQHRSILLNSLRDEELVH